MDKTEDMIIRLVRGFENMLPVFWLLFNENIDDISVYICVCVVFLLFSITMYNLILQLSSYSLHITSLVIYLPLKVLNQYIVTIFQLLRYFRFVLNIQQIGNNSQTCILSLFFDISVDSLALIITPIQQCYCSIEPSISQNYQKHVTCD